MNTENDVNVSGLVTRLGLNRRQFLAASTGMAAAAADLRFEDAAALRDDLGRVEAELARRS